MIYKIINRKYIFIITVLAVIIGAGILAYRYWWLPRQKLESPEEKIQEFLPSDVFLREVELLPDISPKSYLVIYIKNPKIDEVPKEKKWLYQSCPASTKGQAIEGIYHLVLFQNNSIINDIVIPPKI